MIGKVKNILLENESDYNFNSDEDSDNGNSDFFNNSNNFHKEDLKANPINEEVLFDEYKNSAQLWSVNQINEEINTLLKEVTEIKNKEKAKKEPSKKCKTSKKEAIRTPRKKKKRSEFCFCKGKYSLSAPMVQCDSCDVWYHQNCVGLSQDMCDRMASYICSECKEQQLEDLDRKNNTFIGQRKINQKSNPLNFDRIKSIIESNKEFYYSSRKNFLELFEGNDFYYNFCKKALSFKESKIIRKIDSINNRIEKLKEKKTENQVERKRGKSLEKEVKDDNKASRGYESDTDLIAGIVDNKKIMDIKNKETPKKEEIVIKEKPKIRKPINEKIRDTNLVDKIKKIMEKCKISQKTLAKKIKLTGGSTALSAWINGKKLFNIEEKQAQIRRWNRKFIIKKIRKKNKKFNYDISSQAKKRRETFKIGEKVDFRTKNDWVKGIVLKISKGQFLVQYRNEETVKKKWVAALAKRIAKRYSKRDSPRNSSKKAKKVKRTVINNQKE